mmetsp:Transcript_12796/g.36507  ORF Transcript_12796/g.36507 Transcript_12796/m.36507 type:complete len:224 (-) Transcript_12796:204-875(-)
MIRRPKPMLMERIDVVVPVIVEYLVEFATAVPGRDTFVPPSVDPNGGQLLAVRVRALPQQVVPQGQALGRCNSGQQRCRSRILAERPRHHPAVAVSKDVYPSRIDAQIGGKGVPDQVHDKVQKWQQNHHQQQQQQQQDARDQDCCRRSSHRLASPRPRLASAPAQARPTCTSPAAPRFAFVRQAEPLCLAFRIRLDLLHECMYMYWLARKSSSYFPGAPRVLK